MPPARSPNTPVAGGGSTGRPRVEIDGITALLMALDRLENRPAPVELLGWI
jgi:hypothetical protein